VTALDARVGAAVSPRPPRTARQVVSGYVALTKPRIIELLLVTTVPTMLLAEGGIPSLWLVAVTLVGGTLAAGSANTLNCYLDRDIDQVMHRTERRPLATGLVSPREALIFGSVLGALAVGWFLLTVGSLPAVLALAAIAFYVGVYTLALKRRTPQNIVWGGAAGCMPVLIGWSAVTGSLAWTPVVLFAIIFFWTPPHYWPLSLRFRDDYAAAGVPMLPVVASPGVVARQVVVYSWVMVAVSLLLWPVAGTTPVYGVVALLLGAAFLREAHALLRKTDAGTSLEPAAMRLFHGSITYLTLLFVAIGVDPLLPF
jgi:protoheme IX farnesyltransferase